MITKRGKLWVVTLGNREEVCVSESIAQKLLDKYNKSQKPKNPLEELAAKAPEYSTFKSAFKDLEQEAEPAEDI